jgi:hypothetical protein
MKIHVLRDRFARPRFPAESVDYLFEDFTFVSEPNWRQAESLVAPFEIYTKESSTPWFNGYRRYR